MVYGTAPNQAGTARLNVGKYNTSHHRPDKSAENVIRNGGGTAKQFISQVDALHYCIELGWELE